MEEGGTRLQTFSTRSAARILAVPPDRIRYWVRRRLVTPARIRGRRYEFAFNELLMLRLAKELLAAGRRLPSLRSCFERLEKLLALKRPVTTLKLCHEDGRIVVRHGGVKFDADSGQLLLDFDLERLAREVGKTARREHALTLEAAAELAETNPAVAAQRCRQALASEPRNLRARIRLAELLQRQGDTRGALRILRNAATLEPTAAEVHYRLGLLYLNRERDEDALTSLLRAVALEPRMVEAHRELAALYEQMGRKREAIRHLSVVHRLTRDS